MAGSGVIGEEWTDDLMAVAMLAVATSCGLWWSYFHQAQSTLEHALTARQGEEQAAMARDVFSLLHFPMLLGVISFAYAIEEAAAHPSDPLSVTTRLALALGLALFVGGMVLCLWRAKKGFLWLRAIVVAITIAAILYIANVTAPVTLAIAFAGVVSIALMEQRAGNP